MKRHAVQATTTKAGQRRRAHERTRPDNYRERTLAALPIDGRLVGKRYDAFLIALGSQIGAMIAESGVAISTLGAAIGLEPSSLHRIVGAYRRRGRHGLGTRSGTTLGHLFLIASALGVSVASLIPEEF